MLSSTTSESPLNRQRLSSEDYDVTTMKSTAGESFIAFVMSGVAAVLAAIVGFVGGIFLCQRLLSGEMTEWALILAPATALVFGVVVFVFAFRKISTYGESSR
jgi:hypothetical protein